MPISRGTAAFSSVWKLLFVALLYTGLISFSVPASGATWDGGGLDGLWSNPVNWTGDVLPTSTSEIVIEGSGAIVHLNIDFTLNDGGKLRIDGSGTDAGTLIVDSGRTLTFNNAGQNVNSIIWNGSISVQGTVNILTELRTGIYGLLVVETGGELNIDGRMYANGWSGTEVLINNGTINLNSWLYVGGTVTNNGLLNIVGGTIAIQERNYGAYGSLVNAGSGTVNSSGGGTILVGDPTYSNPNNLQNEGTFTFAGTIELYREMTNNGSMDLTGGILDIACSGRLRGVMPTFGTVYEDCKVWYGGGGNNLWSNNLNWSLETTPTAGDNIYIGVDEYLTGPAREVHLDVDFEVGPGKELRHNGIVRTQPGQGSFYIDSGSTLTVSGKFVNNYGEVFNESEIVNNGTLENRGHPNINVAVFDNNGIITNNGTLNNAGSPSDSSTDVAEHGFFNNYGTINNNASATINNINGTFTNELLVHNLGSIINLCEGVFFNNDTITDNPVSTTCSSWDGGGLDGLWSNPVNWTGDVLPTSTSEIVIEGSGAIVHLNIDFTLNDGGKLRIDGSGTDAGTLIVDSGRTLTFNNAGQNVNSIIWNGSISVQGTVNILTELRTGIYGLLVVETGGELNIDGRMYANGWSGTEVLINNGTINLNSWLYVGGTVTNNGLLNIVGGTIAIQERNYGAYGSLVNAGSGTVNSSGGGTILVGDPTYSNPNNLQNEGTFTFAGTIELYREMTNNGSMDLTGGILDIACSGRLRGVMPTFGTVYEDCKVWYGGGGNNLWSNNLNWSLETTPTAGDNIYIGVDEYLTGPAREVHLDVDFEVGPGKELRHNGIVRTQPGQGSFYIDSGSTLTVSGKFVNNYGEVFNESEIVNNGTLENRGHPNINVAVFDNNGIITNNGTLNNAGSPSDSSTDVAEHGFFNNYGTINNNASATINNINGTFTSSFATINNSGTFVNGAEGVMELECTEIIGNPVTGEPPTVIPCNAPPIADAGMDQALECTGESTSATLDGSGSYDPDDDALTYTWFDSFGTAGGVTPTVDLTLGDHAIQLEVDDGNGETDTDDVLVTIEDTTPPSIDLGGDVTLEAEGPQGATFSVSPTVDDLCGVWSVIPDPVQSVFPIGTTTVTVEATDDSGNSASDTIDITVEDTTPPSLTVPANITAEATGNPLSVIEIGSATAIDIVDGEIEVVDNRPVGGFPLGTTVVTYMASDFAGNTASDVQEITVIDTTPPDLTPPPDVVAFATGTLTAVDIGTATAEDLFGISSLENDAPALFPVGVSIVTWTAVDGNGNQSQATQTIRVVYQFGGFLPPLNSGGLYKAGRVIPVKFSVQLTDGAFVSGLSPTVTVVLLSAGQPSGEALDVGAVGAASSGNVAVEEDGLYQFNLNTTGLASGSYRILIDLGDGAGPHFIDIGLK